MTRHVAWPLLAAVLLAGCAGTAPPPASTAAPSPAAVSPAPTASGASDVPAQIRATVTAGSPRLIPTYLPAGMVASKVQASVGSYEVSYTDDLHARDITIAVNVGINPPLPGPNTTQARRPFRGVSANYEVYDHTAALSRRSFMWLEPGTWSASPGVVGPGKGFDNAGIEYYLSASGLAEDEFMRVANSLQPVT